MATPEKLPPREKWLRVKDWVSHHPKTFWGTLILLTWLGWCSGPEEKKPEAVTTHKIELKTIEKESVELTPTDTSLHDIMSAEQSIQYWAHFNRIMATAPDSKPYTYQGNTLTVTLRVSKPVASEKKYLCRSFSESLTLESETRENVGIACQHTPGNWCRRFREENKPTCRVLPPGGLAGFMLDTDIGWDNFTKSLGRTLGRWGLD